MTLSGIGGFLAYRHIHQSRQDRLPTLIQLLQDGYRVFFKEMARKLAWVVIGMTILLAGLAYVLESSIIVYNIISFLLGLVFIGLPSLTALSLIMTLVPNLSDLLKRQNKKSTILLLNTSAALAFLFLGLLFTGALLVDWYFGVVGMIGFVLAVVLVAFFLRSAATLYQGAAQLTRDLRWKDGIPVDERNPATVLAMLGRYLSEILGFSSDLMSSYMFGFVASLFAMDLIGVHSEVQSLPFILISIALGSALLGFGMSRFQLRFTSQNLLVNMIYFSVLINITAVSLLFYFIPFFDYNLPLFLSYVLGVLGIVGVGLIIDSVSNPHKNPIKEISLSAQFGIVPPFLKSYSNACYSNGLMILVLILVMGGSYMLASFLGIALSTLGVLSVSTVLILGKVFSAISKHIYTLHSFIPMETNQHESNTQTLYQQGLGVSVIGNGLSAMIGIFSTISLLTLVYIAFHQDAINIRIVLDTWMLLGIGFGVSFFYLYLSWISHGLNRSIRGLKDEVIRQFKELPFLLENNAHADIKKASQIQSRYTFDLFRLPGIVIVLGPILLAYFFNASVVFGSLLSVWILAVCNSYTWANYADMNDTAFRLLLSGRYSGSEFDNFKHIVGSRNITSIFGNILAPNIIMMMKAVTIVSMVALIVLLYP